MANPYHDETGRFCSKGEMQASVQRLFYKGDMHAAVALNSELRQIEDVSARENFYQESMSLAAIGRENDHPDLESVLAEKQPADDLFGYDPNSARSIAERTLYAGWNQDYVARGYTTAQAADQEVARGLDTPLAQSYGQPGAEIQYSEAEKSQAVADLFKNAPAATGFSTPNLLDSKTPVKRRSRGLTAWLRGE